MPPTEKNIHKEKKKNSFRLKILHLKKPKKELNSWKGLYEEENANYDLWSENSTEKIKYK